jgi:hypothetical protein
MLLGTLTVVIMCLVAYAYLREGVFTAFTMCFNVFLSGLVAFNFWEPLAGLLEEPLSKTFLRGYEDFFCLVVLFCVTLAILRTVTNVLANTQVNFPQLVQRGGGALFGLATGYLVAGFLLCALQTLPWHENFMLFDPTLEPGPEHTIRRVLPPDRVWLGLMYRAGAFAFANQEDERGNPNSMSLYDRYYTFDRSGSFELRYRYYRRYADDRDVKTYQHELDRELHGPQR